MKICLMTAMLAVMCAANAATCYMSENGNDATIGTSWATAKRTIQAAINLVTVTDDRVVLSNGVYETISVTNNTTSM